MDSQNHCAALPISVAEKAILRMRQDHFDRFKNLKLGKEVAENLDWKRPRTRFAKAVDEFLRDACMERQGE